MLCKENRQEIEGKKQKIKNKKIKKEREHHLAILETYKDDSLRNMEETYYWMHLH